MQVAPLDPPAYRPNGDLRDSVISDTKRKRGVLAADFVMSLLLGLGHWMSVGRPEAFGGGLAAEQPDKRASAETACRLRWG
jgi:hypothetical protein